jgi:hypothetical protein
MVGRAEEARQILKELKDIESGASVTKFFIGPFGCGKTFIQALIRQVAFTHHNFVVANADFTPERRLYGNNGQAVATYSELTRNLATKSFPDGGALPSILEKWITEVQVKVMEDKNYPGVDYENENFVQDVEREINKVVSEMDELTGGYDFARVLVLYFKGFIEDNNELQRCALHWLRGEYRTKTEARQDLGVRNIIDDNNYYNYIKVLTSFVRQIGYSGLVVNLDEAINLYKITHTQARNKNYETILKMYNDTLQGNLEGLYITISGTNEFLEDERRGLFSYGALKRRLAPNKFETTEYRDLSQPAIKLTPLKIEELYVLLQKLRDIHAAHHGYEAKVTDDEIQSFLKKEYSRPGAQENLTVGDVIRSFIQALDILYQNPEYDRGKIFDQPASNPANKNDKFEIGSRFQKTNG